MQLTQEAIDEFKEIYQKEYDITLTDEQALELATSFFHLMQVIYRPLPDRTCPSENGTLCYRQ